MRRYRKKPVIIEAFHMHKDSDFDDMMDFMADGSFEIIHENNRPVGITIKTLEGDMRADLGDWIIKGVKGEFYPCKADIFELTYEVVND